MAKYLRLVTFCMFWATLCHPLAAAESADSLFRQAEARYRDRGYEDAAELLRNAISLAPDESRYHHLLGKCYGRMAESAGPFQAYSLATKTRRQFEKAVELDGENIDALKDLMEYYREAPGFLGGSRKKADDIEKRISRLNAQTPANETPPPGEKDFNSSVM